MGAGARRQLQFSLVAARRPRLPSTTLLHNDTINQLKLFLHPNTLQIIMYLSLTFGRNKQHAYMYTVVVKVTAYYTPFRQPMQAESGRQCLAEAGAGLRPRAARTTLDTSHSICPVYIKYNMYLSVEMLHQHVFYNSTHIN